MKFGLIIFKGFSFTKSYRRLESAHLKKGLHESTQVVLGVGGGHMIMLAICKVLIFRKFYFYELFYFR